MPLQTVRRVTPGGSARVPRMMKGFAFSLPDQPIMRVGYPVTLLPEMVVGFPMEVELVAVGEDTEGIVEIDVWIPDPYPARAMRTWPHLRGVKLVLSLMAGTEWIPGTVGPHVTICNAHGAHNVSTAEWTLTAILATLKHIPFFLDVQRAGEWKRRFEASANYARITGDARPLYPPVMLEELTGKTALLVGHGAIGKEIERMLEPFRVNLLRVARTARSNPPVHAVAELDSLLPHADIVILILPATPESDTVLQVITDAIAAHGVAPEADRFESAIPYASQIGVSADDASAQPALPPEVTEEAAEGSADEASAGEQEPVAPVESAPVDSSDPQQQIEITLEVKVPDEPTATAFLDSLHGRTLEQQRMMRARILDVTEADLKRVAETYLKPESASIGVLSGPNKEDELKGFGLHIERI